MRNWRWQDALAYFPRIAVIGHDLVMVWLTWQLLHFARYSLLAAPPELPWAGMNTLLVLLLQGAVFWWVGLYRGLWRFASVTDLGNIFRACFLGMAAIVLVLSFKRLDGVPLSVLALYPIVLAAFLGLPRLLYRAWSDYRASRNDGAMRRVLILGAGRSAAALIRDLRRSGDYEPIGLLDDAQHLRGAKLLGLSVLGTLDDVPEVARETAAKLLVIAIPSLDAAGLQRVVGLCESAGLPYRVAPSVDDVLAGRGAALKEVSIEDLLGRQPVQPDWDLIRRWLGQRSILVTGAGGSIGSELCRQCARHGAARLVLVEISELLLSTVEAELRRSFPEVELVPVLGDCGDPAVIAHALSRGPVDAVFHAAAYKHVPVLEAQLREAVRNNVLASQTVAEAAVAAGVSQFVLISTDKAVNPINALGASKRGAEMVCQALDRKQDKTRFVTVRFGNVLGSAGSVVPLFKQQIAAGGPVTVTDPQVTRYFMTIPEACLLILQAVSSSNKGAVYTLDMGEPVPIVKLAEQMIRLAGHVPGRDVQIVFSGLRPGEKLHETLYYADEQHLPTVHPKVLETNVRSFAQEHVANTLGQMREASRKYDLVALARLLEQLVPDYRRTRQQDQTLQARKVVPFAARESGRK
ncbi:MAG: polysaccharide biosynthesis protein [Stenotrophomonas sp.]